MRSSCNKTGVDLFLLSGTGFRQAAQQKSRELRDRTFPSFPKAHFM
jgi:hypothetical protein